MSARILFILFCLSLATNISFGGLYAYAKLTHSGEVEKAPHSTAHPSSRKGRPCILDEMDLRPRQEAELSRLRKNIWEKRAVYFKDIDELRREIGALVAEIDGPLSPKERVLISEHLTRLAQRQTSFRKEVIHHLLDVKGLLDADQRAHFGAILRTKIFRGMSRGSKHLRKSP